ncbi:MAG: 4Fe-4S single cluster domain [Neobacillus sp.]|nr:4Fe-4S single cluster domain [Sphingobacterium sp.]MDF2569214.1 4Fe-4S single cluster domain [Sporomusa sp.]MDF2858443.1 4Fe-4S single cluster domain [Neobacillus sp.]
MNNNNYESLKQGAVTNWLKEDTSLYLLKKAILKAIKPFTRQQVDFNNELVSKIIEMDRQLVEAKLEFGLRHKLVEDMVVNLAQRIQIPEIEKAVDEKNIDGGAVAALTATNRTAIDIQQPIVNSDKLMGKLNGRHVVFRFVPTMLCNLRCSYCFLCKEEKQDKATMFDHFTADEWIKAMGNYAEYDVDFYMWGGEPFLLEDTRKIVKGFTEYDHVVYGRIDHNMTMVEKIVRDCPSSKVKINASWHTETYNFEQIVEKAMLLKSKNMIGMLNFVASDASMDYLKKHNLDLNWLINFFAERGIFMNVAGDFSKGNDAAYREFITQYTTNKDWDYIHNVYPSKGVACDAGTSFFTVFHDGSIKSCASDEVVGNFFEGTLKREVRTCPHESCLSLVSYCHQLDNEFSPVKHLDDYVLRNTIHRRKTGILRS